MLLGVAAQPRATDHEQVPVRVLVVDDHESVRFGTSTYLTASGFSVCGEAATAREAVEKACALHPDVVLMDLMLGTDSGLDAARAIRDALPRTAVAVVTAVEDDGAVLAAIEAGAAAFIVKRSGLAEVATAVRRVAVGENLIDSAVTAPLLSRLRRDRAVLQDERLARLTPKEQEVLHQIALGLTNREIAASMFLSEKTVKNHVTRILGKLEASRRSEAAAYYSRRTGAVRR